MTIVEEQDVVRKYLGNCGPSTIQKIRCYEKALTEVVNAGVSHPVILIGIE